MQWARAPDSHQATRKVRLRRLAVIMDLVGGLIGALAANSPLNGKADNCCDHPPR